MTPRSLNCLHLVTISLPILYEKFIELLLLVKVIAIHFDIFKGSLLISYHEFIFVKSCCNRWQSSSELIDANSLRSLLCVSWQMSLIKIINSSGPRTEPCETPDVANTSIDENP